MGGGWGGHWKGGRNVSAFHESQVSLMHSQETACES
jgi:hypothetical protein